MTATTTRTVTIDEDNGFSVTVEDGGRRVEILHTEVCVADEFGWYARTGEIDTWGAHIDESLTVAEAVALAPEARDEILAETRWMVDAQREHEASDEWDGAWGSPADRLAAEFELA